MEMEEICGKLRNFLPHGGTVGVIGYGARGQTVAEAVRKEQLGLLICDPPLAIEESAEEFDEICTQWGNGMGGCNCKSGSEIVYLPLAHVLKNSDLVILAVPFTDNGPWPTAGMVNDSFRSLMRPHAVLWNLSDPRILISELISKV